MPGPPVSPILETVITNMLYPFLTAFLKALGSLREGINMDGISPGGRCKGPTNTVVLSLQGSRRVVPKLLMVSNSKNSFTMSEPIGAVRIRSESLTERLLLSARLARFQGRSLPHGEELGSLRSSARYRARLAEEPGSLRSSLICPKSSSVLFWLSLRTFLPFGAFFGLSWMLATEHT
jgi:hypothetical protein